ncbi:hypothetical protein RHSIM_Rhsim07G0080300 [Rhododendron simsii]|uniref:Uncharacterized protein n=1 Tax=Rhododendron simsii TaxID=118357 RepID=A0A834GMA6_RHOSS|nr:hypothetical protein RHSIM_Rhsim07G0080300 [Rhododendron simsii]
MMEIWEEEGEQNSEWREDPYDEIGSDPALECIRNFPMYSPPRSLTYGRADQVQSPPLDLFGLQFGYEAYLPPATTTVCNIEASLAYEASLFGLQFEYESYLPPATTIVWSSCQQTANVFCFVQSMWKRTDLEQIENPQMYYKLSLEAIVHCVLLDVHRSSALIKLDCFEFCVDNGSIPVSFATRSQRVYNFWFLYSGCWIGAEMNHTVQFLKVKESNAQCVMLDVNGLPL